MNTPISKFISSIEKNDDKTAKKYFFNIMQERVNKLLDARKIAIASKYFNKRKSV
jgi:hypothetical protein